MFDFLPHLAAQLDGFQLVVVSITICLTLVSISFLALWGAKSEDRAAILHALADLFKRRK